MRKYLFIIILLAAPAFTQTPLWNGILTPPAGSGAATHLGIDWTTVGTGGIPTTWTQFGSTITATGSDQTSAIQTALNNCSAAHPSLPGGVVLLAAGTFTINTTFNLPSNCILRGVGADQTILSGHGTSPATITMGCAGGCSDINYSGVLNIASGGGAGSTSIVLSATTGVSVGTYLVVTELNDTTFVTGKGNEGFCYYCDNWGSSGTANDTNSRDRGQIVEVTSIAGTTVGISPALYSSYTNSPTVVPFAATTKWAGIENLQVLANNSGYTEASIYQSRCAYCWVKGVETNYSDGNPVEIRWGYRDEIRDSYFSNCYSHSGGTGVECTVFPVFKTSASLIENNIMDRLHPGVMLNWGAAGNVVAYNYSMGEFGTGTAAFNWDIGGVQLHGASPQFNLIEGNVIKKLWSDNVHGGADNLTAFRNFTTGAGLVCPPVTDGTRSAINCTSPPAQFPFQESQTIETGTRNVYFNLVGNITGSAAQNAILNGGIGGSPTTHVAILQYPSTRSYDAVNYNMTFGYGTSSDPGSSGTGCNTGGIAPCHSTDAFSTVFLQGNYTHANTTTTWIGGTVIALPPSFYKSSKPAWWGSLPWPAIGPDITGGTGPGGHTSLTAANPAQNCYISIMGGSDGGAGSPRTFNADACYALAPTSPTASLSWTGSPGPLNFGNVIIINTSSASTITLTNTGTATLNISSITITGDYAKTATCGVTLAVSANCTISVTFTPSVAGTRTGVVTVTDDSGGTPGSQQTVNLTGNGTSTGAVTYASLPLNWVNNTICNPPTGSYDQTIILDGATSTNNGPNLASGVLGSKYPANLAGLKDAINNWRDNGANASCATRSACATPVDAWWLVKVPAGTLIHGSTYDANSALVSLPGKSLSASSMVEVNKCLTIDSTTPLPGGVMACGRGLPGQGGARNPGCASPNDKASMWQLQMDTIPNAGVVGMNSGADAQVNTTTNYSNHILIEDVEFLEAPGSAQSKNGAISPSAFFKAGPNVFGTTPPTLPRASSHIGLVHFYIHGSDPGDAGQSSGPTYAAATDASGQCLAWYNSGVVNIVNNGATATITLTSTTPNLAFGNSFFGPTFIAGSSINFGGTMTGAGSSITGGANYVIAAFDPTTSNTVLTVTTSGGLPATASGVNYLQVNPPSQYATGCGDDANNGVAFNVDYGWMMDGYIEKMHQFNGETHAASFGFDNGIEKIVNNWLEGGSESLFSGGAAVDKTGGPGSDNEIRRNYIGKDLGWRFLAGASANSPNPPFGCGAFDGTASHNTCPFAWDIKNDFELKMGHRNLVDGNVIENSWADGQTGYCVLMNVEAASGGQAVGIFDPVTGLPNSYIDNIRFSNNWVRNCPQAIQTVNRGDMGPANGGGITLPVINVDHINNLFSNISDTNQFGSPGHNWQWTSGGGNWTCSMATAGSGPFTVTGNCLPYQTDLTNPAHVSNISVDASHNVTILHGAIRLDPTICQGTSAACIAAGQTVVTSGVTGLTAGAYAIANAGGTNWATDGTGGSQITYNDGASAAATLCTSVATCTTLLNPGVLTFASLGGKMTGMQVGDDVYATDLGGGDTTCSGHGYAVGLTGQHGLPGPATYAVSGTVTTGLTVVYQVNLTPTPGSATCLISNGAGFPKYVTVQNNTFLSPNIFAIQNFSQFWQPIGNLFFNNVFADNDPSPSVKSDVICSGSPSGEGTVAFGCWDSNTFQYYNNVMMGRDPTKWSAFNCPSGAPCTSSTPALSGSFPTGACPDGNAPYNCPLMALPWSSNFSLANVAAMSITSATQGVDVTQMSTAFTRNGYVCPLGANCGSTGPFPDFTPTSQNLIAPALNMVVQNRIPEVRGNP